LLWEEEKERGKGGKSERQSRGWRAFPLKFADASMGRRADRSAEAADRSAEAPRCRSNKSASRSEPTRKSISTWGPNRKQMNDSDPPTILRRAAANRDPTTLGRRPCTSSLVLDGNFKRRLSKRESVVCLARSSLNEPAGRKLTARGGGGRCVFRPEQGEGGATGYEA